MQQLKSNELMQVLNHDTTGASKTQGKGGLGFVRGDRLWGLVQIKNRLRGVVQIDGVLCKGR